MPRRAEGAEATGWAKRCGEQDSNAEQPLPPRLEGSRRLTVTSRSAPVGRSHSPLPCRSLRCRSLQVRSPAEGKVYCLSPLSSPHHDDSSTACHPLTCSLRAGGYIRSAARCFHREASALCTSPQRDPCGFLSGHHPALDRFRRDQPAQGTQARVYCAGFCIYTRHFCLKLSLSSLCSTALAGGCRARDGDDCVPG